MRERSYTCAFNHAYTVMSHAELATHVIPQDIASLQRWSHPHHAHQHRAPPVSCSNEDQWYLHTDTTYTTNEHVRCTHTCSTTHAHVHPHSPCNTSDRPWNTVGARAPLPLECRTTYGSLYMRLCMCAREDDATEAIVCSAGIMRVDSWR